MDQAVIEEKKIRRRIGDLIDEDRVVDFSDAVFAFAATLLVLKIDLPNIGANASNTEVFNSIMALWPQYLANIITFLVIGYYWLNHHAIFGQLKRFNSTLVWMNLVFLIFLAFLPFPVDLYGDLMMNPVVVVFYSASLAVVGYILALMWWYASNKGLLVSKEMDGQEKRYYFMRTLLAPVVFTLSIPLVYIHPVLAQFAWVLIIIGIVVLPKTFRLKRMTDVRKDLM